MTTRLLNLPDDVTPPPPIVSCEAIKVGGTVYRHSAAKFWPRLVDESFASFPSCTRIELTALTADGFDPVRLDPHAELQRDAERLAGARLQDVIQDTLAQLELLGPPGLIGIRLLASGQELYKSELPADCVDAEIFMYLAGWLLEWARIPHADWSADRHDGQFVARDARGRTVYLFRFDTLRQHVSEGLHRITLTLDPRVAGPTEL
ncbi:MAG: hypothetical protein K8T26_15950 [Lentisphaerae bacterium]|nr:hypothetical protein [Lentisphaerota bacterium]